MSLTHMSMHPPRARQRGMGMTTIMVIIGVAIFIGTFAFKIGPHYMENMAVSSVAKKVAADTALLKKSRSAVYKSLNQAYSMNNLWDLKAEDTILLIKDKSRGYVLTVQYEKRANLFANIDVVTRFDTVVENPS